MRSIVASSSFLPGTGFDGGCAADVSVASPFGPSAAAAARPITTIASVVTKMLGVRRIGSGLPSGRGCNRRARNEGDVAVEIAHGKADSLEKSLGAGIQARGFVAHHVEMADRSSELRAQFS